MSTITTVNTYETVETTGDDHERNLDFFKLYGWDVPRGYDRARDREYKCGLNVGKLHAAAKRDKRPGCEWWMSPSQCAAIMANAPLTTAKPKATNPRPSPIHALQPTTVSQPDYAAMWKAEMLQNVQLRAEVASLTGILARHHIAVIRRVS